MYLLGVKSMFGVCGCCWLSLSQLHWFSTNGQWFLLGKTGTSTWCRWGMWFKPIKIFSALMILAFMIELAAPGSQSQEYLKLGYLACCNTGSTAGQVQTEMPSSCFQKLTNTTRSCYSSIEAKSCFIMSVCTFVTIGISRKFFTCYFW